MRCDLCQGSYRKKKVVLSFQRQGKSVLVEDVPALVCHTCGDTLLSEAAVRQVEQILDQEPQGTAPLYRFPKSVSPVG